MLIKTGHNIIINNNYIIDILYNAKNSVEVYSKKII